MKPSAECPLGKAPDVSKPSHCAFCVLCALALAWLPVQGAPPTDKEVWNGRGSTFPELAKLVTCWKTWA